MLLWAKRAAAALLAGLVSASACAHDWDSLEAAEGSGGTAAGTSTGGDGTGGSGTGAGMASAEVVSTCQTYCGLVECATNDPTCQDSCESEMTDCAKGELEAIQGCFANLAGEDCQSVCAGWEFGIDTCLETALLPNMIDCWSPPHSGC